MAWLLEFSWEFQSWKFFYMLEIMLCIISIFVIASVKIKITAGTAGPRARNSITDTTN